MVCTFVFIHKCSGVRCVAVSRGIGEATYKASGVARLGSIGHNNAVVEHSPIKDEITVACETRIYPSVSILALRECHNLVQCASLRHRSARSEPKSGRDFKSPMEIT